MDSDDEYGPALPPGLASASKNSTASSSRGVIGPVLPPGLCPATEEDGDDESVEGASSPSHKSTDSEDDGDDSIGPVPLNLSEEQKAFLTSREFERRAERMKAKLTNSEDPDAGPAERETWMTELPQLLTKNFGLENRQFSKGKKTEVGDRSVWTKTPTSKGDNKEKESDNINKRKHGEAMITAGKDLQLKEQVEDYNKSKRPKSLLEMHEKKEKKKKKKEKKEKKKKEEKRKKKGLKEDKVGRRPFDRDLDLKANQFDDAQRKLLIQKSQVLNTRFSHGATTSSFL